MNAEQTANYNKARHRELRALQALCEIADASVMDTIHNDQTRHRHANIETAQIIRRKHEERCDAFYEEHHEAIREHADAIWTPSTSAAWCKARRVDRTNRDIIAEYVREQSRKLDPPETDPEGCPA